jgi:hypothetical protein
MKEGTIMKKILAVLVILCLMMSSTSVFAENFEWTDDIAYGETKTITIPEPDGNIKNNWVYFTQYFIFTPEVDGTYRFMISYEEDESKPYDIFMDVAAFTMVNGQKRYCSDDGYWEIKNGCEFEGKVGRSYELMFQYATYDGRHPEFTFYVESDDVPPEYSENPKTGDTALLLPMGMMLMAAMLAMVLLPGRKKFR